MAINRFLLLVIGSWIFCAFTQPLVNQFIIGYEVNFFEATALSMLIYVGRYYVLFTVLLLLLTYETWVLLYPGVLSLCYLTLGILILRYHKNLNIEGRFYILMLFGAAFLTIRIESFIIIWLMGGFNLFPKIFEMGFWLELISNSIVGFLAYFSLAKLDFKFKIFFR